MSLSALETKANNTIIEKTPNDIPVLIPISRSIFLISSLGNIYSEYIVWSFLCMYFSCSLCTSLLKKQIWIKVPKKNFRLMNKLIINTLRTLGKRRVSCFTVLQSILCLTNNFFQVFENLCQKVDSLKSRILLKDRSNYSFYYLFIYTSIQIANSAFFLSISSYSF